MEHSNQDQPLSSPTQSNHANPMEQTPFKKGIRFWAIIGALAVTGLLTALEATITSTALPTIIEALGGASLYVWVINLYFLTMYAGKYAALKFKPYKNDSLTKAWCRTAFQPLWVQLANVFGRRYPLILSTAIFTFGSGICGGASNISMMIAGRALQG
ncbi:MAG: hypothetical protein Q9200_003381 [Gallowayella weberi]